MQEKLRDAVEAQARARVAGDMAAFASYTTPVAVLQLRDRGGPVPASPKAYEVLGVTERDGVGISEVRFSGGGSFVVRQRWEAVDGHWRVVAAELPAELVRPAWWKRIIRGGRPTTTPPRRELH